MLRVITRDRGRLAQSIDWSSTCRHDEGSPRQCRRTARDLAADPGGRARWLSCLYFDHVRRGLKDFQRATVDYVFDRLYGADPTKRFLVADEVGLGKTLVARGVIAQARSSTSRTTVERIDVVYVCSNAEIARQNIRRLNVTGDETSTRDPDHTAAARAPPPDRLRDPQPVNFVSFTPGTSFDLGWSTGVARERALLLGCLSGLGGSASTNAASS